MDGYGVEPRVKNGPALAGYGAEAMRDALAEQITGLPEQLRRSLTWDRGKELAQHAQLKIDTGIASTSPTRTARGSVARTRTPTDCCASTSRKAPTCPDGRPRRSKPSLRLLTAGHARHSDGRPQPKLSTNSYSPCNKPVLRPPVESGLRPGIGVMYQPLAVNSLLVRRRVANAWARAAMTRSLVLLIDARHPRMRREYTSVTNDTYRNRTRSTRT